MSQVTDDVERRRREQDRQWGGHSHDDRHGPTDWVVMLARFLGKAAASVPQLMGNPRLYREALIDLAAVAVAAAESYDRKAAVSQRGGQ